MNKRALLVGISMLIIVLSSIIAFPTETNIISEERAEEIVTDMINSNFVFFTENEDNIVNDFDIKINEVNFDNSQYTFFLTVSTIKDGAIKKADIVVIIDAYDGEIIKIGFNKPELHQGRLAKIVKDSIDIIQSVFAFDKGLDNNML